MICKTTIGAMAARHSNGTPPAANTRFTTPSAEALTSTAGDCACCAARASRGVDMRCGAGAASPRATASMARRAGGADAAIYIHIWRGPAPRSVWCYLSLGMPGAV